MGDDHTYTGSKGAISADQKGDAGNGPSVDQPGNEAIVKPSEVILTPVLGTGPTKHPPAYTTYGNATAQVQVQKPSTSKAWKWAMIAVGVFLLVAVILGGVAALLHYRINGRSECVSGELKCPAWTGAEHCIPNSAICDGVTQCADGSDERNCDGPWQGANKGSPKPPDNQYPVKCDTWKFRCHDKRQCIREGLVCDGVPDCDDESDENLCTYPTTTTRTTTMKVSPTGFYCGNKVCYNGHTCVVGNSGMSYCLCNKGYTGLQCETYMGWDDKPPSVSVYPNRTVLILPINKVTLCGKAWDDHGIASYSWSKSGFSWFLHATMMGTSTSCMTASELKAGTYTFRLTVTDTAGQTNSTNILVIVKQSDVTTYSPWLTTTTSPGDFHDNPPFAQVYPNVTNVYLPYNNVTLCSQSWDDHGIASYYWDILNFLPYVMLGRTSRCVTAYNMTIPGTYPFRLKVTDTAGQTNRTTVYVYFRRDRTDNPPFAHAGPNGTYVYLPNNKVTLCSYSWDDYGIVSYFWNRLTFLPADMKKEKSTDCDSA